MKFVAFFALFAVAASKPIQFDSELNEHWNEFKKAYGKNYDVSEEISRRSTWEKAVKYITQHNLRHDLGLTSYRMGLNEHSDMEQEEFERTIVGNLTELGQFTHGKTWTPPANFRPPRHVDWRKKGLVTPVKNQGTRCGSCWSFASTGALEGMHAKKTGRLVSLSEQNLVDCAKQHGCGGGSSQTAFDWVINHGGIDTEASYPYIAKEGRCKFNPWNVGARPSNFYFINPGSEEDLKKAVAFFGPVSVTIVGSNDNSFKYYRSGIYDKPDCKGTPYHLVLVVGYGTENGKDYWLVKNSWGTSFGIKGYWKMSRNKNNQCLIAQYAVVPVA